jgi:hypothetical protein
MANLRLPAARLGQPAANRFYMIIKSPWKTALWIVAIAGALLRVAHIWKFDSDWEPDCYQHVLFSLATFADFPTNAWLGISVWAKPFYTYFMGLAYVAAPDILPNIVLTQLVNTGFWLGAVYFTDRLVTAHFKHPETRLLLLGMSLFGYTCFRASVTANTEPMGAFMFALGLWLYDRGRIWPALLALGTLPLIRTDAVFAVAVFPAAEIIRQFRAENAHPIRCSLLVGLVFSLPLAIWNLAGYVHTGSLAYVVSHGYPSTLGIYGFGELFHYPWEFLKFDPMPTLLYPVSLGLLLYRKNLRVRTTILTALATALYLAVMTAFWTFGAFGSAGLTRYFVFCFPGYLFIAGIALDELAGRFRAYWHQNWAIFIVAGLAVPLLGLHWFLRAPQWHHGLLSSLPVNQAKQIRACINENEVIYTDYPAIAYYAGLHLNSARLGSPKAIKENKPGLYFYVRDWTDGYSGLKPEDFAGCELVTIIHNPHLGDIQAYRHP